MSGIEIAAAAGAAGAGGAAATGAAATGAAATAAGATAAGAAGLGGAALGSSTALGSGILAGGSGLGLSASAVPAGFGTLGGMGAAAEGAALGSGITGIASTAPEASALFASAATPSSFVTPFTVGDMMGKLGSGLQNYQKADAAMKLMSPQQQGGMMMDAGQGTYEGRQRAPISPFGPQQSTGNGFADFLMQRKQRGLMG